MLIKVGYIKSYDTRFTAFIQCGFYTTGQKTKTITKNKTIF